MTDIASTEWHGSGIEPTTDDRCVTLPPLPFPDGLEVVTADDLGVVTAELVLEVVDRVVDGVLLVVEGVARDGVR